MAREAASLLYSGMEKEYSQAKLKAAQHLGTRVLPSNTEIALELDQIAEETEGATRIERLIRMRREALKIMILLNSYCPKLIGSVWRGNARRGSDIDIEAYSDEPEKVLTLLREKGIDVSKTQRATVTEHGETSSSLHIYAESPNKWPLEIIVRTQEEARRKRSCDIFGDEIKGLNLHDLERLLEQNPGQRFLP